MKLWSLGLWEIVDRHFSIRRKKKTKHFCWYFLLRRLKYRCLCKNFLFGKLRLYCSYKTKKNYWPSNKLLEWTINSTLLVRYWSYLQAADCSFQLVILILFTSIVSLSFFYFHINPYFKDLLLSTVFLLPLMCFKYFIFCRIIVKDHCTAESSIINVANKIKKIHMQTDQNALLFVLIVQFLCFYFTDIKFDIFTCD